MSVLLGSRLCACAQCYVLRSATLSAVPRSPACVRFLLVSSADKLETKAGQALPGSRLCACAAEPAGRRPAAHHAGSCCKHAAQVLFLPRPPPPASPTSPAVSSGQARRCLVRRQARCTCLSGPRPPSNNDLSDDRVTTRPVTRPGLASHHIMSAVTSIITPTRPPSTTPHTPISRRPPESVVSPAAAESKSTPAVITLPLAVSAPTCPPAMARLMRPLHAPSA